MQLKNIILAAAEMLFGPRWTR